MARVFIGIPTLNRPQLVQETIASIRDQSRGDYRAVVSDNRSAGDAADRVERHVAALDDPRFSFHRQPVNGGEYGQGRFFFAAAAGHEFFMILHDDDVLNPDYLERGVRALDDNPDAAFFVANPYIMNSQGIRSNAQTARYLREHGRLSGVGEGLFDVLALHLKCGFAPISGTLFRTAALQASGFVDPECHGNYPFESNIFVRLGEIGAKGWFAPRELLGVRYHETSLRNNVFDNPDVVRMTIRLMAARRFAGGVERLRRAALSRLYRTDALLKLRDGDIAGCRARLREALRENPTSLKGWALAPPIWLCPGWLRAALPPIPARINAPDSAAVAAAAEPAPSPRPAS